jgi:uncharacterized protein
MRDGPRPVALVTGASGGIGEAIARRLAAEGEDLVLVARSATALAVIAEDIAASTGRFVLPLPLDLEKPEAPEQLAAAIAGRGLLVRHLVNNAGYGLAGDMAELPRQGQLGIVDLNCRALLDLTLRFLPDIVAAEGGVLNVASVAAFTAGPGFAVYYASKAFVLSLTRALKVEMKGTSVRVCALCPGPTPTRFGERAGFRKTRLVALTRPLDSAGVAAAGVAGYRAGRTIVIPGFVNKLLVLAVGLLPQAVVLPILARAQRGRRVSPAGSPVP